MTYLWMRRSFLYLVAIMDRASRKVWAWLLSNTRGCDFLRRSAGGSDTRQRHAQGRRKKMVTPAARREAVAHLRTMFEVSERRAYNALGADRTAIPTVVCWC